MLSVSCRVDHVCCYFVTTWVLTCSKKGKKKAQ